MTGVRPVGQIPAPQCKENSGNLLPEAVLYTVALRRVPAYAALFDELRKHSDAAAEFKLAMDYDDQQP